MSGKSPAGGRQQGEEDTAVFAELARQFQQQVVSQWGAMRQGAYAEGWLSAIDTMYDLMVGQRMSRQEAYDECRRRWREELRQ